MNAKAAADKAALAAHAKRETARWHERFDWLNERNWLTLTKRADGWRVMNGARCLGKDVALAGAIDRAMRNRSA